MKAQSNTNKRLIVLVVAAAMTLALHCKQGQSTGGKITGTEVTYEAGGVQLKGYLAVNTSVKGKRPGVLVVHEWWGHNKYARRRARMLAELGYTALAVDMYGNGKQASHPKEAGAFAGAVMKNFATGRARFDAAAALLKKRPEVDPQRLAAIGYCFGGGVVLNLSRQGYDLKAVVSFHGSLAAVAPAKKGAVKARLLVLHGGADSFMKPAEIEAFKKEMKDAGADMTFVSYPGAKHGFTNPGADAKAAKFKIPLAYNAEADQKTWQAMQAFFKKTL